MALEELKLAEAWMNGFFGGLPSLGRVRIANDAK